VPEAVLPAVEFLNRTDFKLQDWDFYQVRGLPACLAVCCLAPLVAPSRSSQFTPIWLYTIATLID
jgi:hypothetical protein